MTTKVDSKRAACMATTTPAAFARAYHGDDAHGRSVRNTMRSKFGVFVSRGGTFNDSLKSALYDVLEGNADALSKWQEVQPK